MSSTEGMFIPLTDEDLELFNSYKDSIKARIHETFPSMPDDYDLKPISIHREIGCGTFYRYKVNLADDQIAEVAFHLGGKRAVPLVGPPHFEITKMN